MKYLFFSSSVIIHDTFANFEENFTDILDLIRSTPQNDTAKQIRLIHCTGLVIHT